MSDVFNTMLSDCLVLSDDDAIAFARAHQLSSYTESDAGDYRLERQVSQWIGGHFLCWEEHWLKESEQRAADQPWRRLHEAHDVAQVRQRLVGRVAEPHGRDVAGDDEGVAGTVQAARRLEGQHGRVEHVGQRVAEEARQLGVIHAAGEVLDRRVDGGRGERESARA